LNKSNLITLLFQNFIKNKNIKVLRGNIFYYFFFRICRPFLNNNIEIKTDNFRVLASYNKNKTSYFLLKKSHFGDDHELNLIKKFSKINKLLLLDCGANYGFYSLYTASISADNYVIAFEASKNTCKEFYTNLELNSLSNIKLENMGVSNSNDKFLNFNESQKDWESSLSHNNFISSVSQRVKNIRIDDYLKDKKISNSYLFIKLDVEGSEFEVIKSSLNTIKKHSPIIIIEFSKYNLNEKNENYNFLNDFLEKFNYKIYSVNKKKVNSKEILSLIKNLKKRYQTIGNYYLIRSGSKEESLFLHE
jgi:FkbM family methyltransferase|tara:strand:+ start:3365 stop:4279 length:915 start_codon:yes stop_codon:yes gene_type:complete